jgi:CHAD domain-containing protein
MTALEPLARDDAAAAALVAALEKVQRTLMRRMASLADGTDEDFGHASRVAIRKARTLLALDHGTLGRRSSTRLRTELGWLAASIGAVRDPSVARQALIAEQGRVPDMGSVLAGLDSQRRTALVQLRTDLASPRLGELLAGLARALELARADATARPLCPLAASAAAQRLRRVLKAIATVDADADPEAVHELRKDAKKLRYALEASPTLMAVGWARPLVRVLKRAQAWLGHYQDLSVRIDLIEACPEPAHPAEQPLTARLVLLGQAYAQRRIMAQGFAAEMAPLVALEAELGVRSELKALARSTLSIGGQALRSA